MKKERNYVNFQNSCKKKYIEKALLILDAAKIVLPKSAIVNIYHHCGNENFEQIGAVFINIVNRDYCKSYVIMLPNQKYPCHYHKIKKESFYVLYGNLEIEIDGTDYSLDAGEMIHIERGQDHMFWSVSGTVFEEISTNYIQNDSFYLDEKIQRTTYAQRRTTISLEEWEEIIKRWKK